MTLTSAMSQKYVVYTFSLFLVTLSTIKGLTIVFSNHYLLDIGRDIMKTFKIGNDRSLKLNKKNDCISIEDKGTKKAAYFTRARWASFLLCLDQIDDQLRRLSEGEDVVFCLHYGGAGHVSLTKGFRCVDLRKFFVPKDQNTWKPTKTGIALRLHEWPTFKQAAEKLRHDNPAVANFTPCFLNTDHNTSMNCP